MTEGACGATDFVFLYRNAFSSTCFAGAPCDSLFKAFTFLSLALACTLSTNENKFSSVNVSQREPYEKTTPEGVVFDCAI